MNDATFSLRKVFWKEKLKHLEQGFAIMKEQWYTYGTKILTHEDLKQFYELYHKYISKKNNAKISDLIEIYTQRIDAGESIYIWYIKKWSQLLWWGIFIDKVTHQKRWLVLGFRAFEWDILHKLSIGYYIEYLYFLLWLDLGVEIFTRWIDRNWYGLLWSNIGLAIHKIQLHFVPHIPEEKNNKIEIDPTSIQQETIIFSSKDPSSDALSTVNIWASWPHSEIEKKYSIFTKRWFDIKVFTI